MKAIQLTLLLLLSHFFSYSQVKTSVEASTRGEATSEFALNFGHMVLVTETGMTCSRAMRLSFGASFEPMLAFDANNPDTFLPQPAHEALLEGFNSYIALEFEKAQKQIFAGLRFYIKRPETVEDYQAMRVKFFCQPITDIFRTNTLPKAQYQNLTDLLGLWALILIEEGSNSLAAQLLTQIIATRETQVGLKASDTWLFNNFSVSASRLGGYPMARDLFDRVRGNAMSSERIENPIEMAVYFNNMAMLAPTQNIDESLELQSRALSLAARGGAPTPLMLDLKANLNHLLKIKGIFTPPDAMSMNIQPEYGQNKDFVAYFQFLMAKQTSDSGVKEGVIQITTESKNYFKQAKRFDVVLEILKREAQFWSSLNEKGKFLATLNEMRTLLNTEFSPAHPLLIEIQSQIADNSPLPGALVEYSAYFNLLDTYLDKHFLFLTLSDQWLFLTKRHSEISHLLTAIEKNQAGFAKVIPSLFVSLAKMEGLHVNAFNALRYSLLSSDNLKTKETFFEWLDAGEHFNAALSQPKTSYPELNIELQTVMLEQKKQRAQSLKGALDPLKNIRTVNADFFKKQLQSGEALLMAYRFSKGQDSAYCLFYQTQEAAAPQLFFVKNLDKESQLDATKMYGSFAAKLAGRARIFFLASGAYLRLNPYTLKDIGTKYGLWMVSGMDKIGNQTNTLKGSRAVYFHQSAPTPTVKKQEELIRAQFPVTLSFGPSGELENEFKTYSDSSAVVVMEGQVILGQKMEFLLTNSGVVMAENALPLPLGAGFADGIINPYEILSTNQTCKAFIFSLDNMPNRYQTQNLMDLARAATQAGADYCLINTQNSPIELRQAFISSFLSALKTKQAHLAFLDADRTVKGTGFVLIK